MLESLFAGYYFFNTCKSGNACMIAYALLALHLCRIVCFATAMTIYSTQKHQSSSSEASPLLQADEDPTSYGAADIPKKPNQTQKDAQSTGWLDYLIGFGTFWPYIW